MTLKVSESRTVCESWKWPVMTIKAMASWDPSDSDWEWHEMRPKRIRNVRCWLLWQCFHTCVTSSTSSCWWWPNLLGLHYVTYQPTDKPQGRHPLKSGSVHTCATIALHYYLCNDHILKNNAKSIATIHVNCIVIHQKRRATDWRGAVIKWYSGVSQLVLSVPRNPFGVRSVISGSLTERRRMPLVHSWHGVGNPDCQLTVPSLASSCPVQQQNLLFQLKFHISMCIRPCLFDLFTIRSSCL